MRVERGIGLLAAILANQNRDPKTRPEPFTPDDFTPHADPPENTLANAMRLWA
jgi:hypothetical protein